MWFDNLERRIFEHKNKKFAGYTSRRLPVALVWSQRFLSRESAFTVERKIKKWNRKKKEALIRGDWDALRELASRARSCPSRRACGPPQDERG